ncbi:MAG: hypothetical protein M3R01_13335, partial [Actinomycetota bacterium]|nr:hypothetical protein [Actinomycetota bacterium]
MDNHTSRQSRRHSRTRNRRFQLAFGIGLCAIGATVAAPQALHGQQDGGTQVLGAQYERGSSPMGWLDLVEASEQDDADE